MCWTSYEPTVVNFVKSMWILICIWWQIILSFGRSKKLKILQSTIPSVEILHPWIRLHGLCQYFWICTHSNNLQFQGCGIKVFTSLSTYQPRPVICNLHECTDQIIHYCFVQTSHYIFGLLKPFLCTISARLHVGNSAHSSIVTSCKHYANYSKFHIPWIFIIKAYCIKKWWCTHKNHMTIHCLQQKCQKPNPSKNPKTHFFVVVVSDDNYHEWMIWYLVSASSIVFASL